MPSGRWRSTDAARRSSARRDHAIVSVFSKWESVLAPGNGRADDGLMN
jgi:hypothetical protein